MKKIIVATVVASFAAGAFAGLGDFGKTAAGVGAKTAITAAAAAKEQKQKERQTKEAERQREAEAEDSQCEVAEQEKKIEVKTPVPENKGKASQQAPACGKLTDRLASFCGFKFGERGKSGTVSLTKPFRMFKTAKVVCEDEKIKEVTLHLKLTTAMDSDAREKEVAAIKDILEKKYQITFKFKRAEWNPCLKVYTYMDGDGTNVDLYYNNMEDYISIAVQNYPAWKKTCTPAELPADAGADVL